ncbi:zinc finger protein [Abeliophyllum distichum]|uniref:Zinc finger protein n=1 Tax=Abeliophyllum distichum TaxID=126358 RepID=A0ABD1Q2U8_9LAMI
MQLGQANANVNLNNLNTSTYGTSAIGHIVAPVTDSSSSIPYGLRHDNIAISTRRSNNTRVCKVCGVDQTPLWRKGPDGPQMVPTSDGNGADSNQIALIRIHPAIILEDLNLQIDLSFLETDRDGSNPGQSGSKQ